MQNNIGPELVYGFPGDLLHWLCARPFTPLPMLVIQRLALWVGMLFPRRHGRAKGSWALLKVKRVWKGEKVLVGLVGVDVAEKKLDAGQVPQGTFKLCA